MRLLIAAVLLVLAQSPRVADVEGTASRDRWVRIGTGNFELYSDAGDGPARDVLEQLQRVRGFFAKASPLPIAEEFPARIVVFKSPAQLAQFAASASQRAYFVESNKRDFIVMSDEPNQYRFAIHEYMHLIIRHSGLRLPTWLNEGWAEVYSTMRPVGDGVAVGDLVDERYRALQSEPWLPIETLVSM
ncbi:MAG: hypothetical protein KGN84_18900, partial [Acidobacteriota bacterium]|nr:hypothetical protein [Acidobacteriota bacterium]